MRLKVICALADALLSLSTFARDITLSEKPIALRVPVGKEYILRFPQPLTHANVLDEQIAPSVGQLLSPEGILYLTTVEPFEKTRLVAELIDGRLVMIDLTSAESGPFDDSNLRIIDKPVTAPAASPAPVAAPTTPEKNPYKPDFLQDGGAMTLNAPQAGMAGNDYHRLVQSAFQQYYGTTRTPLVGKSLDVSAKALLGLVRLNDGKLRFSVLQSQKIGEDYLTVLLVNNVSHQSVDFDPRAIRGRWVFAATLHPTLTPSGTQTDRTLWALISKVPFDKARR